MAKIKAPLFSLDATGTLDKNITYKGKLRDQIAQKYSKPGDKNPFESSPRQKDQRSIIRLITIHWQCMSSADKLSWENAAKDVRFKGTGYHYFLHMAQQNLTQYLGLVGYWSMNYSIDDKIPDLSGNGNHGILSPIYPCDCPTLVDSFDKKHGKAISLNGLSTFLLVPHCTLLNPSTFWTMSFLLYFRNGAATYMFVNKGIMTLNNFFYSRVQANILYFVIKDGINYLDVLTPFPSAYNNTWTRIFLLKNDHTTYIYLNGVFKASNSNPAIGSITTTDSLSIGRDLRGHSYTDGLIDEVTVWNRFLSELEIKKYSSLV